MPSLAKALRQDACCSRNLVVGDAIKPPPARKLPNTPLPDISLQSHRPSQPLRGRGHLRPRRERAVSSCVSSGCGCCGDGERRSKACWVRASPDQRTQGIFQRPPVSPAVSAGPPRSEAGCANCGASACAVSDSEGDQPPPLAASYAGGWSTATQKGCTCLSKICAAR